MFHVKHGKENFMWGFGNMFWPGVSILPMNVTGDMSDYQLMCRVFAFMQSQQEFNQTAQAEITALKQQVADLQTKLANLQQ